MLVMIVPGFPTCEYRMGLVCKFGMSTLARSVLLLLSILTLKGSSSYFLKWKIIFWLTIYNFF
nr:hypothetical protein Itr_chr13CG00630 [Ipomoea trifida]